jgi:class 3 adenylate cyclase
MVAFNDAAQCMAAAIEIQKQFDGNVESGGVLLRISIHRGPCLAVNLNSGVDYFGNTVNYAAKLQQLAGAREIAYSPEFSADSRVGRLLADAGLNASEKDFAPAWSDYPFKVNVVKTP